VAQDIFWLIRVIWKVWRPCFDTFMEGEREKIDGTWKHWFLVSRNSRDICRAGYVVLLANLELK
jgi:hypothetical protein